MLKSSATAVVVMALLAGSGFSRHPQQQERAAPARKGGVVVGKAVTAALLERGAELFWTSGCASCHASDGRGVPPYGAHAETMPPDLRDRSYMEGWSDSEIARIVRYGAFQMPASRTIRGEDMLAIIAFVRSLSNPDVKVVDPKAVAQGEVENFVPVTAGVLKDPPPGDWLMFRRTYDGWAYSPLDQIDKDNVDELQLAWSRAMEPGGQYTTPLVWNRVMYLAHPGDVIQALDAGTGDLIWEYRRGVVSSGRVRNPRNLAIFEDKIFAFTRDGFLIAINARDGSLVWQTREAEPGSGIGHMAGPIVAGNEVISGRSCAATGGPEICFIAAHDARTGAELWRTHTIPRPGEPGDETWGGVPYENRRHVGAWGVGSYDPELDLIYWGTSVPAPSLEVLRGTDGHDVLYSNSTLALDADTGRIVWYYQHLPRDNWDIDHVFERYLMDIELAPDPEEVPWINPNIQPGEVRKIVTGIPGKTGIVYTLDRETGEFLWARETIHQNIVTGIDGETGRVDINEELIVGPFQEILVCPSTGGGKDWPAGAYSPRTGLMYQPQQNMCMLMKGATDKPAPEDGYATSRIFIKDPTLPEPYLVGRIDAVSITEGRTRWLHQQRAGVIGSLMATAGGLVFGGDVNRRFMAFDDSTGELLWETIVSGPVSGSAVSYAMDGRQYVAVPVGGDTASPEKRILYLHHEINPPQGINAIFVFALRDPGHGKRYMWVGTAVLLGSMLVFAGLAFVALAIRRKG